MGFFNRRKNSFRIDDYTKQDIEVRLNKPTGWIDEAIEEINNLEKRTSSDSDIRYSLDVDSYISESSFNKWEKTIDTDTFQSKLLYYIDVNGLSNKDFYKAAHLDRKLFSTIKNNEDYKPTKETAVACCIGLRLELDDAEELLGLAGYELSMAIKWDKVIYYCLKNEIYDFDSINYLLYLLHEKGIRL